MVIHSTTRIFVPPPKSFFASTLDNKPDAQLWHERTMHMSIDYLRGMGLQVPAGGLDYCNTCVQVKARRYQPRLDPEMRRRPTRKGEVVAIDLLLPSRNVKTHGNYTACVMWIALATKYPCGQPITDRSTASIRVSYERIRMNMELERIGTVVMDRESACTSKEFLEFLTNAGTRYKLVPRDRHGEFNPFAERLIGIV